MTRPVSFLAKLTSFRIPAIALLLGLLPFWVFVGAGETRVYNGETIELSRFNLMGFVLAVVGLLMALQWIFRRDPDAPRPVLAVVLSIAAVLVCLVQAAETSEIFTLNDAKRLATRKIGWPPLPASRFTGLDPGEEAELRSAAAELGAGALASRIARALTWVNGDLVRRNAYSAKCYGGLDSRELLPVPDYVSATDRKTYDDYVEAMRGQPVGICSDTNSTKYMGDLAGRISENIATSEILADAYRRRFPQR